MAAGTGLPAGSAIGPGATKTGARRSGKSVAAVTALPTGTGHTRGRRPTPAAGPTGRAIGNGGNGGQGGSSTGGTGGTGGNGGDATSGFGGYGGPGGSPNGATGSDGTPTPPPP